MAGPPLSNGGYYRPQRGRLRQEAEDLRADLIRDNNTIPAHAIAGNKSTERLSVGMRMQIQYASLDTNLSNVAVGPVATDHFFTRRMYLTLKSGFGDWGATMTYDLAGQSYDDAIIEWKPTPDLAFNFGLRKVNVIAEERASTNKESSACVLATSMPVVGTRMSSWAAV